MPSIATIPHQGKPIRHRRTPEEVCELFQKASEISQRDHAKYRLAPVCNDIPKLDISDITFGKVLGRGAFGAVYAVSGIESSATEPTSTSTDSLCGEQSDEHYALKFLSSKAVGTNEAFLHAVLDTANEAVILRSLNHPHIIKIRAMPICGMFSEKSFLLIDRLEETLKGRFEVWRHEAKQMKGIVGKVFRGGNAAAKAAALEARMHHLADLADALAYMHSLQVIHRDLKPENLGFDQENKIQLFDFGLAREMPLESRDIGGLFKMTGYIGSPLYMSPEIALKECYNEKCDVYSFAILLWQTLTLERPFHGTSTVVDLQEAVWQGEMKRPPLDRSWSDDLKGLLVSAWSPMVSARPDMNEVSNKLRQTATAAVGMNANITHLSFSPILDNDASATVLGTISPKKQSEGTNLEPHIAELERDMEEETQDLPKFHLNEVVQGRWLGRGGFCDVFEISAIMLSGETEMDITSSERRSQQPTLDTKESIEWRKFLSRNCQREYGSEDARFAIKRIRQDIREDPKELCNAIADLNVEISILKEVKHSHIIKARGLGAGPRFHADAFLIVDRLYDTLGGRMKRWREEKNRYKGLVGMWQDPLQTKKGRLWRKRLAVALDLSSALSFLHSKRIIHRDIKPQNVGFDMVRKRNSQAMSRLLIVQDDVKLFDFGLARKLPRAADKESAKKGDLFRLSMCGSLRYMAPEVFCKKPYGETCDVYSYTILLWEVLSLKDAFRPYDCDDLMLQHVHSTPFRRPRIKRSWPLPLKDILQEAWHPVPYHRPYMLEVEEVLGRLLQEGGSTHTTNTKLPKTIHRRTSLVLHCDTSITSIDEVHGCW
eukprot:Nitzschia sp. Nitz4//scaffold293_size23253//119//3585//NITZ4_008501-RA/size23253-snap-gene-0.3-mRNA-1//1//CDS//3329546183//7554//frame0